MAKRAAILEMHADGAGVREIARATGVDRSLGLALTSGGNQVEFHGYRP
jgi:hypothetical protein